MGYNLTFELVKIKRSSTLFADQTSDPGRKCFNRRHISYYPLYYIYQAVVMYIILPVEIIISDYGSVAGF